MVGLAGAKDRDPEVPLTQLEQLNAKGGGALLDWLRDETGRSPAALRRALEQPDPVDDLRFRTACGNDAALWESVRPFAALIRANSYGYPVIVPPGSVYMTAGTDRRTSGTQYTPRSLTGPVVQYTLEPLVYEGPAEGRPRTEWKLRPARDLLALKICDPACGSGAFLVETCRYLGERLVEAWEEVEARYPAQVRITPEGEVSRGLPTETVLPRDPDERVIYARRIIAQRCLYGVDKNPLAVEMAKLSLWLLTLEKNKPFSFLDHAIKCGDSLLGVTRREQVEAFEFAPRSRRREADHLLAQRLQGVVEQALDRRRRLEASPAMPVADVEHKEELLRQAEDPTSLVRLMCDLLTGAAVSTATGRPPDAGDAFRQKRVELWRKLMETYRYDENVESWRGALEGMQAEAAHLLNEDGPASPRRPFHWPVEFPEVFVERSGFDALVGNPPFMGGQKITGALGTSIATILWASLQRARAGARTCVRTSSYGGTICWYRTAGSDFWPPTPLRKATRARSGWIGWWQAAE